MLFNIMRYITEKLSPTPPEGMVNVEPAIAKIVDKCKLTEYVALEQMITTGYGDIIDGTPCHALEE